LLQTLPQPLYPGRRTPVGAGGGAEASGPGRGQAMRAAGTSAPAALPTSASAGRAWGAAPLALLGQDLAVADELATPHTPGLAPGQRAGQAGFLHRAGGAERLGRGDVVELLG